jgi:5,5'-dehydrodivanillate O-demethylase
VEGDCIRCVYHGGKYDGTGQCVEMPAEDPSFPPKVRIASYPTQEYLGLIWAYLGEGEVPELPRYPVLEADGVLELMTYTRACNYFNNWENAPDPVHLPFVHRLSGFTHGGLLGVPEVSAEESEWGLTVGATRPSGVRVTQLGMPNIAWIKNAPGEAEGGWQDAFAWKVPLDDEHHQSFNVTMVHVVGEARERYLARRRARAATSPRPVNELVAAIMRGELRIEDVADHPGIINVQDSVAQIGQGPIADRLHERLGRSDVGVIRLRQIWARELAALAEGRPLKQWRWHGVETTVGA